LFSSSQIAYARSCIRDHQRDKADGLQYKKWMGHNSGDTNLAQQLHESERVVTFAQACVTIQQAELCFGKVCQMVMFEVPTTLCWVL